jgi:CubicO group peptidase (beta-lactamase class C family)
MRISLTLALLAVSLPCFGQRIYTAQIDNILKEEVESEAGPGITIGVVKDGHLIYHNSRGYMNLEYDIPFNDSTIIGLASVTKQFTAACVGILESQGKLSVHEDIRKYIPELTFYNDTIRIKHLLNHTSGIRNHNVLLDLMGFDYEHQGYTNRMIEQLMFRQKGVNNRPGEKMLYSNTNYVLLALLVKRVSGMPIHEFAKKELFAPLGMKHSFYRNDLNRVIKNRAYPYSKRGDTYQQPNSLTLCVGAGGMKSTVADLAKWSQVFLDPEHRFSYLGQFITTLDTLTNGTLMKHARGMFVSPYQGYKTFNHSGRDRGMRSQFICVPELDLSVMVYANSNRINAVDVSYRVLDLFIQKSIEAGKLPGEDYKHKSHQLAAFAGIYQEMNSDMQMRVFVENDTLKAKSSLGRIATPLESKAPTGFHRMDNASVTYTFPKEASSNADLEVDFGGAIFYFEKIKLDPYPDQDLEAYVGDYYSEELEVTYTLTIKDHLLMLAYPNHPQIMLREGQPDVFGSNRRTKYTFHRTDKGQVSAFEVAAEGTVSNILFERIE